MVSIGHHQVGPRKGRRWGTSPHISPTSPGGATPTAAAHQSGTAGANPRNSLANGGGRRGPPVPSVSRFWGFLVFWGVWGGLAFPQAAPSPGEAHLQSTDGSALEAQICFEVLSNFTHQALEGKFADQKFGRLLIAPDFTESHGTRPFNFKE